MIWRQRPRVFRVDGLEMRYRNRRLASGQIMGAIGFVGDCFAPINPLHQALVTAVRASALGNRLFGLQNTRNATLKILSSPSKHLGILHHDTLNLLGDGVKRDASCAVTIAPQPKVTPAIPHICQPTNSAHDLRWSSSISSQSSPEARKQTCVRSR